MAIVSFWSRSRKETGKSSAVIALATYMAIEHNYKILVVSTCRNDDVLRTAYWNEKKVKKNLGLFGPNTNVISQNGIEGLNRFIRSNKITPDVITNYTKTVFKNRLEVLLGHTDNKGHYDEIKVSYPSIIEMANQYYDLVLVDLDNESLDEDIQKEILRLSNLVIVTMLQRMESIDKFKEMKQGNQFFNNPNVLLLVGKFDRFSKYTAKNITRYLKEKNEVNTVPYNTLFFEACEDAGIPDLFLRLRKLTDETDKNAVFIKEIKRLAENVVYRLQDSQMRKR